MTAALVGAAAYCRCSIRRPTNLLSSSISTNLKYLPFGSASRLGIRFLSPWQGLKRPSISLRRNYTYFLEKKGKLNRMAIYASLFGVGAPEALVIGVVALLIFGPKGLAEVARNLGKTLRSFQPTINELQEVSREFKSTFERELGLDEVTSSINNSAYRSNSVLKESRQDVSIPNGRPAAEPRELLTATEELAGTAKPPEDGQSMPDGQPQEDSESTPSTSTSSEDQASISPGAKEQASPLQRTETE